MGFINRIAVLPFENNTTDKFAPERARNSTITQILSLGIADVIDKGLVDSVLLEEAVEYGKPIDQVTLKRLGQRLNIQAFFMGTVNTSNISRKGSVSYPEISLTLRLIDARAAMILWQASGHQDGDSTWARLFGLPSRDAFYVSNNLIRELLSTIPTPAVIAPPVETAQEKEK
ncbi:hypothetical protein ACFL6N_01640 [Thermodesulfobacteriota bacterium]